MRVLKPLVVVLGGIRIAPVDTVRRRTKQKTKQRHIGGVPVKHKRIQRRETSLYPAEERAAARFRKNAAAILRRITFSTPIGRIALRNSIDAIMELREHALTEAVLHNQDNPHWHVLVEGPTYADIPEDAQSTLLTVLGGRLPDWMFEEVPG